LRQVLAEDPLERSATRTRKRQKKNKTPSKRRRGRRAPWFLGRKGKSAATDKVQPLSKG